MDYKKKEDFLKAVTKYNLGSDDDNKITAHTSAVSTNDWKKIEEELKKNKK